MSDQFKDYNCMGIKHSCTYLGHIDGERHRKVVAERDQLRAECDDFKNKSRIAFEQNMELLLECHAENSQMRVAMEEIKFEKSLSQIKSFVEVCLRFPHTSRLAKRMELMEQVILTLRINEIERELNLTEKSVSRIIPLAIKKLKLLGAELK